MQVSRFGFVCIIVLCALSLTSCKSALTYKVGATGNLEEWREGTCGESVSPNHFVSSPAPSGTFYAFYDLDNNKTRLVVLFCDASGRLERKYDIAAPELGIATAVTEISLTHDYMYIENHVNPSLSIYVKLELASGDYAIYSGAGLVPSPSGKRAAYFVPPPHFGSPLGAMVGLYVDKKFIATIPIPDEIIWVSEKQIRVCYDE